MGMICYFLSSSAFILTIVTAPLVINLKRDVGDCEFASRRGRLDVNVTEPKAYEINFVLRPGFDGFFGSCNIWIQVHQSTKTISVYAYKMEIYIQFIQLRTANIKTSKISPVKYQYCNASQILYLHFENYITPAHYNLYFSLYVPMERNAFKGLVQFRQEKHSSRKSEKWFMTNLFESNSVRRIFPCWDEPGMKAPFNISIIHPKEYIILSNTPIVSEMSDALVKHTYFDVSPLIAPSEVAFVMFKTSREFITHNFLNERRKEIFWIRRKRRGLLTLFLSLINIVKTTLFSTNINLTILPKTDYVVYSELPVKSASSVGLSIYREQNVIYNETLHFPGRQLEILKFVARQETFQYFSELGISSPWLRESLAMYFSHYFSIEPYHSSHLKDLFTVQILQPILYYDTALRMKSVIHESNKTDAIDEFLYSRLNAYKGSIILRMLEHVVTPNVFHEKIWQYINRLMSRPVEKNFWDVVEAFEKERDIRNLSYAINGWLRQKHFPELYVTLDNITVDIEAICYNNTKWDIPFNILSISNQGNVIMSDNITWIECPGFIAVLDFEDINFAIVNLQQFGFYRVNYDIRIWTRITSYLQYEDYTSIPVQNRAQLIDDAYHYVISGKLSVSIFLNLITYLKRETHYVPWYTMFNILSYMSTYMRLPSSKSIKVVILDSLDSLLTNIGYEERIEDDEMTNSLRLLASRWACELGHMKCHQVAASKLIEELGSSPKQMNLPWWKDWVYCMGMKEIKSTTWHSLFSKFLRIQDTDAFKYLACTDNDTLLIYYMDKLTKDERIMNLIGVEELPIHYRSILKRHLRKNSIFENVLKNFNNTLNGVYEMRNFNILCGDIIFNLHPAQIEQMVKFSSHIFDEISTERSTIKKFANVRFHQIIDLKDKFTSF
ncbi:thyrotropin-releasing hormone-degrading ectoenzyme-like [Odontomachus brunneus]|uniref:thyrotropin-releasing hormone-degrading ectoenzyme-like n=1 Tax=Odontomachus brunneus TaxID=486640 RepID=UPI0013F2AA9D|nr:thyrotropin-releasing hormone-degrading ectoenzyme-like [Odontomachus brunneus]XP_032687726.1 thyrotropin-releasing hormone-degrading ectoenzyme-like [Odontomachus brunneus]XP_032687727.1 thyrotropin-releasing hormone-degrading ectoenzyme-like [Odontomachus brunneus]